MPSFSLIRSERREKQCSLLQVIILFYWLIVINKTAATGALTPILAETTAAVGTSTATPVRKAAWQHQQ
jgi:hypothetical protein